MEEEQDLEDELNLRDGWDTDDDEEASGKFKWTDSGKGKTDDEEEEEEEEAPKLPFQVLCSHVCRRWYEVAVGEYYQIISLQKAYGFHR